jgi:hypothetical protein
MKKKHRAAGRLRLARWTAACLWLASGANTVAAQILISEIRIDNPGTPAGLADAWEFVELVGPPGTSLDDLSYVVVGDELPEGGDSGMIEKILELNNQVIGPSGRFVIAQSSFPPDNEDYTLTIDFEDGGTVTHMLVRNLAGASVGTLIDTQHDGFIDYEPWEEVLDALAIVHAHDDTYPYGPAGTPYGPDGFCVSGVNCNLIVVTTDLAGHVYRCPATGTWHEGSFDPSAAAASDSPGATNSCPDVFGDGFEP